MAVEFVCKLSAPVAKPGRRKTGIDGVGLPSGPSKSAVIGPVVAIIEAVYASSVLPMLKADKRKEALPGRSRNWEPGVKLADNPAVESIVTAPSTESFTAG